MASGENVRALPRRAASSARLGLSALTALTRAGIIAPVRPDKVVSMVAALRLGLGPAALVAAAAARRSGHPAVIDDRETLTYGELDARGRAIAAGLRSGFGLAPGRALAVMCRNHGGFVQAVVAGSRCGADLLALNTEFSAAQLASVLERTQPAVVVHDEEFASALDEAGFTENRVTAWHETGAALSLGDLAASPAGRAPSSLRQGRLVILTSGTTGIPKSAPRDPSGVAMLGPMTTFLSRIPLRVHEPVLIAPPIFHGFGLGFVAFGLFLGSTLVLPRRFDPEATLAAIEEHRITTLIVVPIMLHRILQLPEEVRARYDTSCLRTVLSAAAPLSGELASAFMDVFGDVLYNAYGSTETGFGAIARPSDLRAAPGTVGLPAEDTTLKILDGNRAEAAPGETGHVFIGGPMVFEGYGEGGSKETVDGLMNTGDMGHFDADGRLFIDGREDDMVVSGGENVFPGEVEDVIRAHPGVADVAVLGVDDVEFGQRLQAFVVKQADAEVSSEEMKSHVRARLERYKVPRDFIFVDELPRNPTGKLLRSRLEALSEGAR